MTFISITFRITTHAGEPTNITIQRRKKNLLLRLGAAGHGEEGDDEDDPPVPRPAVSMTILADTVERVSKGGKRRGTYFWKNVFSGTSSGPVPSGLTTMGRFNCGRGPTSGRTISTPN